MIKRNNWKLNEPRAIIIAAVITSLVTISVAYFQHLNKNKSNNQCERIKTRAELHAEKLNDKILTIENDRDLINHTFWRDKFEEISNYSCDQIEVGFEKILRSFEKASKQLDL